MAIDPENIPFQTINWETISKTTHAGTTGVAWWQTLQFAGLRVRIVEYSPGYLADHWCQKGHIVYCLEGEFVTKLQNGESYRLTPGMSYQVADNVEAHRSFTATGVKLFIVD